MDVEQRLEVRRKLNSKDFNSIFFYVVMRATPTVLGANCAGFILHLITDPDVQTITNTKRVVGGVLEKVEGEGFYTVSVCSAGENEF